MNDDKKIKLLRIFYWYGAILDLIAGVRDISFAFYNPSITNNLCQLALLYRGVVVLWGTFIFIWADQKPVERRFILSILIIPVITFFALIELIIGFIELAFFWIIRIVLVIIPFTICYILTRNIELNAEIN